MELNEKIIECVRKHTCLYEPADRNYKNAVLKAKIWQQIADQLNENSDLIKKKWKSMRDGYMKYKKHIKGCTGSERKIINFMWSAQLTFLDSSLSPRPTESNVGEGSQTAVNLHPPLSTTPVTTSPSQGTASNLNEPFEVEPVTTSRRAKKRTAEPNDPDLDEMIKNYLKTKKENPNHDHDSVDYLFLSYAKTFKKFSLRKQAILKVDLAKLFSEAELSEISTETDSPAYTVASSVPENMNSDFDNTCYTNICSDNIPQNLSNTLLVEMPCTPPFDYSTIN